MRRLSIAALLALLASVPANACLNDKELPQREREFRSQYMGTSYTRSERSETAEPTFVVYKAGGIGLALLSFGSIFMRRNES